MTAPTALVRAMTYKRDAWCLNCGTTDNRSWQHRAATGMGGGGSKAPKLTTADGVLLCLPCNQDAEAGLQAVALSFGWKIRRFRGNTLASEIPVFDRVSGVWFLPDAVGRAKRITAEEAQLRLISAGSIVKEEQ